MEMLVPIQEGFDYLLKRLDDEWPENVEDATSEEFTALVECAVTLARDIGKHPTLTDVEMQACALAWVLGEMPLDAPQNAEDRNERSRAQRMLRRLQGLDNDVTTGRA